MSETKAYIIDKLSDYIVDKVNAGASDEELKECIKNTMKELRDMNPSATIIHRFADNGWMDHTCSNCGYTENNDIHVIVTWKYCPHCGIRFGARDFKGPKENEE